MEPRLQPVFTRDSTTRPDAVVTESQNRVLRNTYWLLALSMLPTIAGAWVGMQMNFVALFINGQYKGYYNPTERVHEEMLQNYLGGSENWDVVSPSFAQGSGIPGVVDGDRNDFTALVNYINQQNPTKTYRVTGPWAEPKVEVVGKGSGVAETRR